MPTRHATIQIPQWSKRAAKEFGGRDPLGLSRVAFLITDYLLKGIITTTNRARYYSYYPWALWHIENAEESKTYGEFIRGFRRREAFMALSTVYLDSESSVVGTDTASPKLEKGNATGTIDIDFKVLPSNPMGGFGQYYGGSLYGLGLTHRNDVGVELCAPGVGVGLAMAYHETVAETPFCKAGHFKDASVTLEMLKRSASAFSLDSISQPFARKERELLKRLFFSWEHSNASQTDILRRHTLALILDVVRGYNECGKKPSVAEIEEYLVRRPYYYDVLFLDKNNLVPYQAPHALASCYGFWKQFCVHQYLTQALEILLSSILGITSGDSGGLTPRRISELLTGSTFATTIGNLVGSGEDPCSLLKHLNVTHIPSDATCRQAQRSFGAKSRLSEEHLLSFVDGEPETDAAVALTILAVLYSKWRSARSEYGSYISSNAGPNLHSAVVLASVDDWLKPGLPWPDALLQLIEPFVLQQHDRVMYEKGRLESSWFQRIDGKIQKDQDYEPGFRSSRHWNCVMIMNDLGLLRVKDSGVSITTEGSTELSKVLKDDGANEKR